MTTNRPARSNQQTGTVKTFLVVGSLVATLAGTRLLAAQDTAVPEIMVPDTAVPVTESVTVVVPSASSATLPLPPTSRGTQIELQQIPQVVQPHIQPVARTRSSR